MDRADDQCQSRTTQSRTGQISAVQNILEMNRPVQNIAEQNGADQGEQNRSA
jgi:hypothetical protein